MKHIKSMNFLLGLALVAFLGLLVANSFCGCAVLPHKEVSYFGKADATVPYVELNGMEVKVGECWKNTNTCEALVSVNPVIHNPSVFDITGTLTCSYVLGDEEPPPLVSGTLKVSSRKSKVVDMSNMFTVPADKSTFVTVACSFKYSKEGTKHSSFRYMIKKRVLVKAQKRL